jgi:hypothetical protein
LVPRRRGRRNGQQQQVDLKINRRAVVLEAVIEGIGYIDEGGWRAPKDDGCLPAS